MSWLVLTGHVGRGSKIKNFQPQERGSAQIGESTGLTKEGVNPEIRQRKNQFHHFDQINTRFNKTLYMDCDGLFCPLKRQALPTLNLPFPS